MAKDYIDNNIPYGIEILLKKAAIDSEFRERLLESPDEAARQIGLELDPIELGMLQTIPREQLDSIIAQTEVPASHRRAFLGTAAAAMLAVLTGTQETFAGAPPSEKGSSGGIRPGNYDGGYGIRPDTASYSLGIRPDEVQPRPSQDQPPPVLPVATRVRVLLEKQFRVPRNEWKPTTPIKTDKKTLPKFRQAIYDEFDVRMPAKTLKSLKTVKKLTEYLEESLEGYEEKKKEPPKKS